MKIAPQAWRFAIPAVLVGAAGLWLAVRPGAAPAGIALAALGFLAGGFTLYFFRDPERPAPTDAGKLYSPGDGTVLSVAHEDGGAVVLRIFLSVFNVHVQRAPCAGEVVKVETIPGSFAAAMKDEARANSRVAVTLDPGAGRGPVVVEQIAGLIARVIECWPKAGERLAAGQRYGIIYFGSQAAVRFPPQARCTVKPGDKVVAGVTEIGEWTGKR